MNDNANGNKQTKQPGDAGQIGERAKVTAQKTWGVTAAEFYAGLQGKAINVTTIDAKIYGGFLVGVDQYDIFIKTPAGVVQMIAKHAIKSVMAAPATNGAS